MKSLKESLFDDNITKELTIRDAYDLLDNDRGIAASGFSIGQMFNANKIEKYNNPYTNYRLSGINLLDHFIGIIMDQPAPTKSEVKTSNHKWCENLKKVLTKYVNRSWRFEWDKKIDVYLIEKPNDCFAVSIDFDCGTGSYEFIFKQKNS